MMTLKSEIYNLMAVIITEITGVTSALINVIAVGVSGIAMLFKVFKSLFNNCSYTFVIFFFTIYKCL